MSPDLKKLSTYIKKGHYSNYYVSKEVGGWGQKMAILYPECGQKKAFFDPPSPLILSTELLNGPLLHFYDVIKPTDDALLLSKTFLRI